MKPWTTTHPVTGKQRLGLYVLAQSKGIEIYEPPPGYYSPPDEDFPYLSYNGHYIVGSSSGPDRTGRMPVSYDEAIKIILEYEVLDNKS